MAIRNTWPASVRCWPSRGSRTHPVPSIAACSAGSASTAKIASAGALMIVVALMVSSVMVIPPCELSWVPDLTPGASACLVLLPVICFSFPGRSARSGTACRERTNGGAGGGHIRGESRESEKTRTRSAELGPHLAQTALQEALFDLAGCQGHRGVKFSGRVARAAEPAQVVRQGSVPQMGV